MEDCLFLDVFAPSNVTHSSKLPVWFFIQGGGYAGNTDDNFNATEVIRQSGYKMVFVQINYRVGSFGFLAGDEVRRNGDLNAGLLDQRKALEWVQKYIHLVRSLHKPMRDRSETYMLMSGFDSLEETLIKLLYMVTRPAPGRSCIISQHMLAPAEICLWVPSSSLRSFPRIGPSPIRNFSFKSMRRI